MNREPKEIVLIVYEDEPRIDSRVFAEHLKVDHSSVMRLIGTYENQFQEFGLIGFKIDKLHQKGRPQKYSLLNEGQSIFLLTLSRNSDQVVILKSKLTKAFMAYHKARLRDARKAERHAQIEWQQARLEGKVARREETEHIRRFVEYAQIQGSKNARWYYRLITETTYKALGFIEKSMPDEPIRELLDRIGLAHLATAEFMVAEVIEDGMNRDIFYKDIFKLCKLKLESLADVVGRRQRIA